MAEDKYHMFTTADKKTMGGIVKTEAAKHTKGPGAVKLYIYVQDLEKSIDVRTSASFLLSICP
jgi:predicted enzyme related to lactoylglutathione lyase